MTITLHDGDLPANLDLGAVVAQRVAPQRLGVVS